MRDYLVFSSFTASNLYSREELELLLGINDQAFRARDEDEVLQQLLEYRIGPIDCSLPFSWDFSVYSGRDIPYRMHSFRYIGVLLYRFWQNGSKQCRDRFLAYVLDWVRAYPCIDLSDLWAWHDDATARRVYFFCVALYLFDRLLTKEQISDLRRSLDMQARLLCTEKFYKANHNHGMYQDRALAMYGLLFSPEPAYHLMLARERAGSYFQQVFTEDAVHKEHSPNYHIDMAASIEWFALVYREISPAFSAELHTLCRRMAWYITWITRPDRMLPSIGDSQAVLRAVAVWKQEPAYQWIVSGGLSGCPPEGTMEVFRQAGYGVIRDGWTMDGTGTWMLLLASSHSSAHKHNDDLSFLLYHNGPLITEAGNRNYNYSDPMTEYCYSAQAHNMFFLNDGGYPMKANHLPLLDENTMFTGIVSAEEEPGVQTVSGMQKRIPGTVQKRSLRYYHTLGIVEIRDEIVLQEEGRISLLYHIAPGIKVRETGSAWQFLRGDQTVAWVYLSCGDPEQTLRQSVLRGESKDLRCAVFHGQETPRYGALLIAELDGAAGRNVIRFVVELCSQG